MKLFIHRLFFFNEQDIKQLLNQKIREKKKRLFVNMLYIYYKILTSVLYYAKELTIFLLLYSMNKVNRTICLKNENVPKTVMQHMLHQTLQTFEKLFECSCVISYDTSFIEQNNITYVFILFWYLTINCYVIAKYIQQMGK